MCVILALLLSQAKLTLLDTAGAGESKNAQQVAITDWAVVKGRAFP